nr:MAG TPA: hypothetical protein [Caudoviricetes sp.]
MINISEEIKSFVDEVEFFGGKFDPFFVDEDNKLLIHLDGNIHKVKANNIILIRALFLMYKKFETQNVKADIEVTIKLKDQKIQSVYYEPQYMAVIEEEGDLVGAQPLYFDDPTKTLKERKIFLSYISHCINELIRRCFNDERSDS